MFERLGLWGRAATLPPPGRSRVRREFGAGSDSCPEALLGAELLGRAFLAAALLERLLLLLLLLLLRLI